MMYGGEPKRERFCLNNEKQELKQQRDECPTNLVDVLSKQERLDQQKKLIQDMTIEKHQKDQKRRRLYNHPDSENDLDQKSEQTAQVQLDGAAKTALADLPASAEPTTKKEKAESGSSLKETGDDDESHESNQMFKIIHDVRRMNKEKYELLQKCHENLHGRKDQSLIPEEIQKLIDECETR